MQFEFDTCIKTLFSKVNILGKAENELDKELKKLKNKLNDYYYSKPDPTTIFTEFDEICKKFCMNGYDKVAVYLRSLLSMYLDYLKRQSQHNEFEERYNIILLLLRLSLSPLRYTDMKCDLNKLTELYDRIRVVKSYSITFDSEQDTSDIDFEFLGIRENSNSNDMILAYLSKTSKNTIYISEPQLLRECTALQNYITPITRLASKIRALFLFIESTHDFNCPIFAEFYRFIVDFIHFDILFKCLRNINDNDKKPSIILLNYLYETLTRISYDKNTFHYCLVSSLFARIYQKYMDLIVDWMSKGTHAPDELISTENLHETNHLNKNYGQILSKYINEIYACGNTSRILSLIHSDTKIGLEEKFCNFSSFQHNIWKNYMEKVIRRETKEQYFINKGSSLHTLSPLNLELFVYPIPIDIYLQNNLFPQIVSYIKKVSSSLTDYVKNNLELEHKFRIINGIFLMGLNQEMLQFYSYTIKRKFNRFLLTSELHSKLFSIFDITNLIFVKPSRNNSFPYYLSIKVEFKHTIF
ncbi:hypothetical protein HZS_3554 [Henneguya salminicola]|nr:hypothetical protein HZS_3554 [Henneguya salminicola]